MNCPICYKKMKVENVYGEQSVEESYEKCTEGCKIYASEWQYGSGVEYIGTVILYNHYTDSVERREENSVIRNSVCERYRKII